MPQISNKHGAVTNYFPKVYIRTLTHSLVSIAQKLKFLF